MEISSAVSQVYINDEGIETLVCANNFFSFIAPDEQVSSYLELIFVNCKGVIVFKKNYDLPFNGSKMISIKSLFEEENIKSKIGSVLVSVNPKNSINIQDKIGKVTSQFYVQYRNEKSLSTVHPQSTIDAKQFSRPFWKSNQIINTNNLKSLRIYQCNHARRNVEIEYSLYNHQTNEKVATKKLSIDHLSSGYVEFDKDEIKDSLLHLQTNTLPCGNSKPLIMRLYEKEIFSISHG